jgi:hypothetical protein
MADWQFEADEGRGGGDGAEWMQGTVADWWSMNSCSILQPLNSSAIKWSRALLMTLFLR